MCTVPTFKSTQLSFETDLDISELVESAARMVVGVVGVGGVSLEGEEASIVGRLTGLLGTPSSSSLSGADRFRNLSYTTYTH